MKRLFIIVVAGLVGLGMWSLIRTDRGADAASGRHTATRDQSDQSLDLESEALSMADVIDRAKAIRAAMTESLDDYTAQFVKQERDQSGVLGPETIIDMKVQTRVRGDAQDAPLRVFLRFVAPEAQRGRKVIWGEDLYDGKMAVHETGMLLKYKTIWLDPNGMIAMQGQRYPISEIGMVKLVEKLIERGLEDVGNPDISIRLVEDHDFGGRSTELLQVRRTKPSGNEGDFSLAEIVLDPQRNLLLQYKSFGWPDLDDPADSDSADSDLGHGPLLESYTYRNVQVNVGLEDIDFDVKNPEYEFPAF